ncbi:hypothetical protein KRR39_17935 [Nocardioides panacis]|uniref:Uncharacterized protein n=1 Tax=Nocardioides panacis TaxID=2849501 RepID=A0A975T319_9ACTN|nr:hypothetical protein KRR39_17935 [Nocardioides panacis]
MATNCASARGSTTAPDATPVRADDEVIAPAPGCSSTGSASALPWSGHSVVSGLVRRRRAPTQPHSLGGEAGPTPRLGRMIQGRGRGLW